MSWHIGIVGRGSHRLVERELAVLGVPAFYPRLRRWVSHARVRVAVERPLLGGYLFVEGGVDHVDGLRMLRDVGGSLAVIADELVFDWRQRYMRGEFDVTASEIPIGALVRVVEGEFAEQLAIVTGFFRGKVCVRPQRSVKSASMQRSNINAVDRGERRVVRS